MCLPSLNASLTCRVFDVQKHYWGATIVAHGFRALYMDSDAIVLKNPLPWFSREYDVQASGCACGWPQAAKKKCPCMLPCKMVSIAAHHAAGPQRLGRPQAAHGGRRVEPRLRKAFFEGAGASV